MSENNQVDRWCRSYRNSGKSMQKHCMTSKQRDLEEGDDDTKYDRATNLKIGQLVLIKNNTGTVFDPKHLADIG